MDVYVISGDRLTAIADEIRSKTDSDAKMTPAEMAYAISTILSVDEINGIIERTAEELRIPTVTRIGSCAFYKFASLKKIDLPLVRTISDDAFNGCSSLEEVTADSLAILGARVFNNCPKLKRLDLRNTRVSAIPAGTFSSSGLDTLWLPSDVFCSAVKNSFSGCPISPDGTGGTIYMPLKFRTRYESNAGWSGVVGSDKNRIVTY